MTKYPNRNWQMINELDNEPVISKKSVFFNKMHKLHCNLKIIIFIRYKTCQTTFPAPSIDIFCQPGNSYQNLI